MLESAFPEQTPRLDSRETPGLVGVADQNPADPHLGPSSGDWLSATLDELDYGVLLLADVSRVVHVNSTARDEIDVCHPLRIDDNRLTARRCDDASSLQVALLDAAHRGLRKLITVGCDDVRLGVSVIPLRLRDGGSPAALVILGKRDVCGALPVQAYARCHGLTGAELRVLAALCDGADPAQVAKAGGVAISTIRTQINSIRSKTGAQSIRDLVRQVAVLPPMRSVLSRRVMNIDSLGRIPA